MMKTYRFILAVLMVIPAFSLAQTENDYLFYKNFVRHSAGELCNHVPPATGFTVYLNQDQSRILIDNAPRWSTGGEANIPGNGTFGVELGNFANPAVSIGDSVFIRFTCNTAHQQAVLNSRVAGIPWYYFPASLYLQATSIPEPPQNVSLALDTLSYFRTISWSAVPGMSYDVYRRVYSDTLPDGRSRMQYFRVGTTIMNNSFTDNTTLPTEKYGYLVYAINGTGVRSSHSVEVNEDPLVHPGMDLTIKYITRLPRIAYVWGSTNPAVEGWPQVNSPVTWRAVVRNWSDSTLSSVSYKWILDGVVADSGTISMPAGDTTYVDFPWTWTFNRHVIAFVIDPNQMIPEEEEENNRLEIFSNAITAGFYVEQSVYDYFHQYQKLLGAGSNCWEDWAHRHIRMWNNMFTAAIYPDAPSGVLDRIRLDKITVVPDGALPLAGGLPSNNPNLNDRYIDLQWGFNIGLLNGSFYANHTGVSMNNPFYFEGSLLHELGHARYLIDLYGFNVHDNGSGNTVAIMEGGQLIVGTPYMPLLGDAVYLTPQRGLMNGQYTWIDEYSTNAMNLIAGHRATMGNYNAPNNIGEFLQDLPAQNRLLIKDHQGNVLPNASVKGYRAAPQTGVWYGKFYDNIPDLDVMADSSGVVLMGRCPFSATLQMVHTYGQSNVILIIRVSHQGKIGYGFLEVTPFNMDYWRGNQLEGNHEISVQLIDPTGIDDWDDNQIPGDFFLAQNFPNPFNPTTHISYRLAAKSPVTLTVFNAVGEMIKTLIDAENQSTGTHSVQWDGKDNNRQPVPSGIYFYRLTTGEQQQTRKMILIR